MVDLQKRSERKERKGKRARRGYGRTERNTCTGLIQRHRSSSSSNLETSTTGTSATTIDAGETIATSKMTNAEQQTRPKTVSLSALCMYCLALFVNTIAGGEDKLWGYRRQRVKSGGEMGIGRYGSLSWLSSCSGRIRGTRDGLLNVQLYTFQA